MFVGSRSVVQSACHRLLAYWTFNSLVVVPETHSCDGAGIDRTFGSSCSIPESRGLPRSHFVMLDCTSSVVCESTPVVHSCYLLRIIFLNRRADYHGTPALRGRSLVTPADAPQINLQT
jgi:hypothetical protein